MRHILLGIAVLLAALVVWYFFAASKALAPIQTTTETKDEHKASLVYSNASADQITVDSPFPGAVVGKTFSVTGKARGNWFFEASFPVKMLDAQGAELATTIATAQGDWMTEDFVSFRADLSVPESYIGSATLVLKKDNPSGEASHDASLSIPITVEY